MPSLMEKIGNRFPREVNAFAAEKHIPVLALKKPDRSRWDDRKLDYVRPCLTAAEEQGRSAVVAIVAAHGCTSMRSDRAPLLQVRRARKDGKRRWMTTTGPDFGGWGQGAARRDPRPMFCGGHLGAFRGLDGAHRSLVGLDGGALCGG